MKGTTLQAIMDDLPPERQERIRLRALGVTDYEMGVIERFENFSENTGRPVYDLLEGITERALKGQRK